MVKTESLDLELVEIGWRRFNLPWCTGYSTKHYQRGLGILIHKDPNNFRPHILHPILIFDIKSNMHNKHLGRTSMIKAENLDGIAPEQYGIRNYKLVDIQALNTRLFNDLIRI